MIAEIAKIIHDMTRDDDDPTEFDNGWDAATYVIAEHLADLFETDIYPTVFDREDWFALCGIKVF